MSVRLFAPRAEGDDWFCAYEIEWPGAPRVGKIGGVDSVQALLLAMQAVAADLYAGRPAGVSDVYWLEPGRASDFLRRRPGAMTLRATKD